MKLSHHVVGGSFPIPDVTVLGKQIDQRSGKIQRGSELGGAVVPRKCMVVVVPTFAHSYKGYKHVLHGPNGPTKK